MALTFKLVYLPTCPVAFLYRRVASRTRSLTSRSPAPHGTSTRTDPKHTVTFIMTRYHTMNHFSATHYAPQFLASILICRQTNRSTTLSGAHGKGNPVSKPRSKHRWNKKTKNTELYVCCHSVLVPPPHTWPPCTGKSKRNLHTKYANCI